MSTYNAPVVSPYNARVPDLDPETPALERVLNALADNTMLRTHVCMPARVQQIHGDQTVDLQLLPKTLYANASKPVDRPIVQHVPVLMSVGKEWHIRVPFDVGDLGLAIFSDRSIEAFQASDGTKTYDPADTRTHDLCDAMFLPGLPTTSQQTAYGTGNKDLVLRNGKALVRMLRSGKVQVQNDQQELLSIVDALMGSLSALTDVLQTQYIVLGAMGTSKPLASSVLAVQKVQAQVQQLQSNLATLRV